MSSLPNIKETTAVLKTSDGECSILVWLSHDESRCNIFTLRMREKNKDCFSKFIKGQKQKQGSWRR